jgi:hypothetical protein
LFISLLFLLEWLAACGQLVACGVSSEYIQIARIDKPDLFVALALVVGVRERMGACRLRRGAPIRPVNSIRISKKLKHSALRTSIVIQANELKNPRDARCIVSVRIDLT